MRRDHFTLASHLLDALHRIVELLLSIVIFLWVAYFAISFDRSPGFARITGIAQLHRYADPIVAVATTWLNAQAARQYVPLVLAFATYLLVVLIARLYGVLNRALWAAAPRPPPPAVPTLSADSEEAREQLHRKYREIEKALKEAKRKRCTFLSVDVAGSIHMKTDESEIAITASFRAYEKMLRRTFATTRAWKQAWTPDGVMACFLNREQAVAAAKSILENLATLNARENELKTPFRVRCGINEGDVVLFEDTNLENVVDHAIDIAAQLQKAANSNTVLMSADLCAVLEDPSGFRPTIAIVEGQATCEWSIRARTPTS